MSLKKSSSSLKKKSIESVAWVSVGYGLSQLLRLTSNIILTRLLAPEYFGLMAIVNVFMIGLTLFSDIGIGQSIIQNKHAEDRVFLNSAWTLQIVRGITLWIFCIPGAVILSIFYSQPLLMWIIPTAGFVLVISGFNSTSIFSTNRNLILGRVTLIELISQASSILLMVAISLAYPSIWALVSGGISAALVKMILSHVWLADEPDRLLWDSKSISSIVKFGKWIFISTILSFFVNSSGSLILGKFITMDQLGLFSIGATLSKTIENLYYQISNKVIFPLYVKIKDLPQDQIQEKIFKIRSGIMVFFLPPLWIMIIFGQKIIDILFDERYHEAGWVFQIFSLGMIPIIVSGLGPFYLALNNSLMMLKMTLFKFICFGIAILIGWLLNGPIGMIYGMALYTIPAYFFDAYIQRKYLIWIAKLDIAGYFLSILTIYLSCYIDIEQW